VPLFVEGGTVTVNVELPLEAPIEVGLNDTLGPVGALVAESATGELKLPEAMTVPCVLPPLFTDVELRLADRLRLALLLTVTETLVSPASVPTRIL
jgi:hypothetical protein